MSDLPLFGLAGRIDAPSASAVARADDDVLLEPYVLGDPICAEVNGVRFRTDDFLGGDQEREHHSFQSIDWLADDARERGKSARLERAAAGEDASAQILPLISDHVRSAGGRRKLLVHPRIRLLWYRMQGWLCAILIGTVCGVFASFIDITGGFLADLRLGYCSWAFWTPRRTCCLLAESLDGCSAWITWAEFFGATRDGTGAGSYILNYLCFVLISVGFAFVAALLTRGYAPYAAGSGIPQLKTILSGFVIRKHLGKWTLAIKTLAISFAVASGLTLGKEGPIVHMAACIGNVACSLFPKYDRCPSKRRGMIASAASAGVCVAFGAPIGGVLFVLEEIAYYFPQTVMWRGFVCSLVAATTLAFLDPLHTGKLVLFQLSSSNVKWSWPEVPFFVLLGAMGGAFGAFFCYFSKSMMALRKHTWLGRYPLHELGVVSLASALINFLSPFMRMDGVALMSLLFKRCETASPLHEASFQCVIDSSGLAVCSLLVVSGLKMIAMVFTNGLPVPAGVFVPSMAAGACFGRAVGAMVRWMLQSTGGVFGTYCVAHAVCVDTSLYAVCGAAAAIGGVTRMTICLVVIMFEITGGVTFLIPLMLAVLTAKLVADSLAGPDDIYAITIRMFEFPFLDPKHQITNHTPLLSFMRSRAELEVVTERGNTIRSLGELLDRSRSNGFPIVNAEDGVVGFISRLDLRAVLDSAAHVLDPSLPAVFSNVVPRAVHESGFVDMRPFVDSTPICVVDSAPFSTVCDILRKTGARYVLVLRAGKLSGIMTRRDVQSVISAERT